MAMTRNYTVILEPDIDGGFVVHVPALPEVCTQGETEGEALANAREAIELAIEERLAEEEHIPEGQEAQVRQVSVSVPLPSAA